VYCTLWARLAIHLVTSYPPCVVIDKMRHVCLLDRVPVHFKLTFICYKRILHLSKMQSSILTRAKKQSHTKTSLCENGLQNRMFSDVPNINIKTYHNSRRIGGHVVWALDVVHVGATLMITTIVYDTLFRAITTVSELTNHKSTTIQRVNLFCHQPKSMLLRKGVIIYCP
jgi:hypothetical protein